MRLSDGGILARLALPDGDPRRLRIAPFSATTLRHPHGLTTGLTSAGYDLTLSDQFAFIPEEDREEIDLLDPNLLSRYQFVTVDHVEGLAIPPGEMYLGMSVERIAMPDDAVGSISTRSTKARTALTLNFTTAEAGWTGTVTLEISNTGRRPVRVRPGTGIGQLQFDLLDAPALTPYWAKGGSYQNQDAPTPPRFRRPV